MTTIKLKILDNIESDIIPFQKQWNSIARYSFNRAKEGLILFDIWDNCKKLKRINLIDISWSRCASKIGESLYKTKKNDNLIFGGKKLFFDRKYNKISKEEFQIKKLIPIQMIGSKIDTNGNRKIKIDLDNNICKVKLDKKLEFQFNKTSKKNTNLLKRALELAKNHQMPMTYSLNKDYLFVSFEELYLQDSTYNSIKNRFLSFDSNPNEIGFSIVENDKILYKEVLNLRKLKNRNKKIYEIFEISKYLTDLAQYYKCESIVFEKLNIKSQNHKKGKIFNRNINNFWFKNKLFNSIRKNSNLKGIQILEIISQYSSFIGQLNNPQDIDSVSASLELARRATIFKKIYIDASMEKQNIMFPEWNLSSLPTQWKEMVKNDNRILSWKDLYFAIKKSKSSYRFLYDKFKKYHKVFRFKSQLSLVDKCPYLN